ncbi:hypothetical protein HNY73_020296 [Argiope bruennichi]|uniref:Uncharacterized protein n=1 Tax=Argiope bruennichi TaxID=94029 RepID=A0A8T0E7P2_ARGBR|nr:hypothetical protein HNY73_020296 [Argiope bruennichi]
MEHDTQFESFASLEANSRVPSNEARIFIQEVRHDIQFVLYLSFSKNEQRVSRRFYLSLFLSSHFASYHPPLAAIAPWRRALLFVNQRYAPETVVQSDRSWGDDTDESL